MLPGSQLVPSLVIMILLFFLSWSLSSSPSDRGRLLDSAVISRVNISIGLRSIVILPAGNNGGSARPSRARQRTNETMQEDENELKLVQFVSLNPNSTIEEAQTFLMLANGNLDQALNSYYATLQKDGKKDGDRKHHPDGVEMVETLPKPVVMRLVDQPDIHNNGFIPPRPNKTIGPISPVFEPEPFRNFEQESGLGVSSILKIFWLIFQHRKQKSHNWLFCSSHPSISHLKDHITKQPMPPK